MANARERLADFMSWRGWSQTEMAEALGVHQTTLSKILLRQRGTGLEVAAAIERVTSQPRQDGEVWSEGPIRATEWAHASTMDTAAGAGESAS